MEDYHWLWSQREYLSVFPGWSQPWEAWDWTWDLMASTSPFFRLPPLELFIPSSSLTSLFFLFLFFCLVLAWKIIKILSHKGGAIYLGVGGYHNSRNTMELTQGFLTFRDARGSFLWLCFTQLLAAVPDRKKSRSHPNVRNHNSWLVWTFTKYLS